MKNVLKKNQLMITALAIMIAVAGYLNFAGTKLSDEELMKVSGKSVASENGDEVSYLDSDTLDLTDENYDSAVFDISDESTELEEAGEAATAQEVSEGTLYDVESLDSDVTEMDAPGEAVFTSAANVMSVSGAKLLKEQTRAKNKETLMGIINSAEIGDEQKKDAIENMIQLTDIAEKETSAEILLEAKGFDDVVVSISQTGVDVVVKADTLSEAQRAQIEDIVTRKTGAKPENIIIQCSK